jgi:tetratricopeptide (TPR) repeat protein
MSEVLRRLTSALSGRYRIDREIGRGGMSTVFLAEDLKHHRQVAIKVLTPEVAAAVGSERFLREIETVARLTHPHILGLYDSGDAEGLLYYVMPYVEGESLRQRLTREKQLPVDDALRIAREVADALSHAHSHGVVHRDIKPENILLESGHAVVADFGIARAIAAAGGEALTQTGIVVGTPAYMSPEQAAGGQSLDGRSDLYSLGCVLYEMLAGQPPFTGPTAESLAHQHLSVSPRPVTELRPAVPAGVTAALQRALAKTPADRFGSTPQFVDAMSLPGAKPTAQAGRLGIPIVLAVAAALATLLLWPGSPVNVLHHVGPETAEVALAVADFEAIGMAGDENSAAGAKELICTGLVEASPCRVVSPELLYDIRRRRFGETAKTIAEDQVLEVARQAGATLLVSGKVVQDTGSLTLLWRLVDVHTGRSIASRRVEGASLVAVADQVVSELIPVLPSPKSAARQRLASSVADLTTRSPEAYRHYMAGIEELQSGRSADAARELEQAVRSDTTFTLAYFRLAEALLSITQANEVRSRALLDKAWALRSRLTLKDRLKLEAMRSGWNYDAADEFRTNVEIAERWPDDPDALEFCALNGTLTSRASYIERGRRLYPDRSVFGFAYVDLVAARNGKDEALKAAWDLVARIPNNPEARVFLASLFLVHSQPDSAEKALSDALRLDPRNLTAKCLRAAMPYYRGDVEGALSEFERLHADPELTPEEAYSVYFCSPGPAELLSVQGRRREVLRLSEQARRESPGFPWGRRAVMIPILCDYFEGVQGGPQALKAWREWSMRPDLGGPHERWEVAAWRVMGLLLLDSLDVAERELRPLEAKQDLNYPYYPMRCAYMRGDLALRRHIPGKALTALSECRLWAGQLSESFDTGHARLTARAQAMAGRPAEAERTLRDCLRIRPAFALGHYELGKVLEQQKRWRDAATEYQTFLTLWVRADKDMPELAEARARLVHLAPQGK